MFKSSLGLGTKRGSAIGTNKYEAANYLKTLKKKQKEVLKKHDKPSDVDKSASEDSDLASLAREFENDQIKDSPFLKRRTSRSDSLQHTPLPEKEVPFISSLQSKKPSSANPTTAAGTSALENFMRFDQKWSQMAAKTNVESESESELLSPSKIASELEERLFPSSKSSRSRRKSSETSTSRKTSTPVNPVADERRSPFGFSARLRTQADHVGLRLAIPGSSRSRKPSAESAGVQTASEVSEILAVTPSPRSPIFSFENLHEIEELDAMEEQATEPEPIAKSSPAKDPEPESIKSDDDDDDDDTIQEIVIDEKKGSSPEIKQPSSSQASSAQMSASKKEDKAPKLESDPVKESQKRSNKADSKSESRHSRRKRSKSRHRRRKECYYCDRLCDFHRSHLAPELAQPISGHPRTNQGVQAGNPSTEYSRHYLFDPTQDLVASAFQVRTTGVMRSAVPTKVLQGFATENPMVDALTDLIRGQLDLTENFLNSQRNLYMSYCSALNTVFQTPANDKIVHPRATAHARPSSLSFSEARRLVETEMQEEGTVESIEEEYESEFESDTSEGTIKTESYLTEHA